MFNFFAKKPDPNADLLKLGQQILAELKLANGYSAANLQQQQETNYWLRRLCRPARASKAFVTFKQERENIMAKDTVIYGLVTTDDLDDDTTKRVVTVTVDGVPQDPVEFGPVADLGDIEIPQDSKVHVDIVDYDDATPPLASPVLTIDFDAADKNPPKSASGIVATFKGERENPDPPTPPVEPTPTEPETPSLPTSEDPAPTPPSDSPSDQPAPPVESEGDAGGGE